MNIFFPEQKKTLFPKFPVYPRIPRQNVNGKIFLAEPWIEHCRTIHHWRDYPCKKDNCEFVAYSKTSAKDHLSKFHSPYQAHNGNYYSCQRAGCKAAFNSNADLARHERIHGNHLLRCVFWKGDRQTGLTNVNRTCREVFLQPSCLIARLYVLFQFTSFKILKKEMIEKFQKP